MDNIFDYCKRLKLIIIIWLISILLSSIMFTIALVYDVYIALIISCVIGILSIIGIFYSGYIYIKLENESKYLKYKVANIENML